MNKFIYPLAAAAALFTGNLFAQEAALSSAENSTTSMYDCVKTVSDANRTLDFEGGVVKLEGWGIPRYDFFWIIALLKWDQE